MANVDRREKWPLKYKIKRLLWCWTWIIFFRPTPKRLAKNWRNFLLTLFGATIGRGCLVCPSCRILEPWNLELAAYIAIGERVNIYNYSKITIGSNSIVSQDAVLCTGTHDYELNHMPLISSPITIGQNVWITSNCFIHPGVNIGDGCVVGACSVVTKDLPAWTVCTGNPANIIKSRKFNAQVEKLI